MKKFEEIWKIEKKEINLSDTLPCQHGKLNLIHKHFQNIYQESRQRPVREWKVIKKLIKSKKRNKSTR